MWKLTLLLTLCTQSPLASLASPFMPRFSGSDDGQPVLHQINKTLSVTWIIGASDKVAYIDPCQELTIRVTLQFPPSPRVNSSRLHLQFACYGRNASIGEKQEVSVSQFNNSIRNGTLRVPVCQGLGTSDFLLVQKNCTDYQLVSANCTYGGTATKAVTNPIHQISIRLTAYASSGAVDLQSGNLTIWFLNSFGRQSRGGITGERLITQEAIDKILGLTTEDYTLWSVQLLTKEALNIVGSLPLYLKQKLNIGLVLTPAECASSFIDSNSFAIVSNSFASRGLANIKNTSQQVFSFGQAGGYFIDLHTGILYTSNANLVSNLILKWSKSKLRVRICELFQFSGHGLPYVREVRNSLEIQLPRVTLKIDSCTAVPTPVDGLLLDVLEEQGKPVFLKCPIVCQVAKDVANRLDKADPENNATSYTCKAGKATAGLRVRRNIVGQFISANDSALPTKIFAMEGESISYSCSALVTMSGSKISTLIFVPQRVDINISEYVYWKLLSGPMNGSSIRVHNSRRSLGVIQTVNVTIRAVPSASDDRNITHRFVCRLTHGSDEATSTRLYGATGFASEISADVVFVPRPTDESFHVEALNETTFLFSLHQIFYSYLAEVGAQVSAGFRLGSRWLNISHPLVRAKLLASRFQPATGSLVLTVGTTQPPLSELTAAHVVDLIAVFSFRYPNVSRVGSLRPLPSAGAPRHLLGSVECAADPRCFYTTDYEGEATASVEGAQLHKILTVNLDLS